MRQRIYQKLFQALKPVVLDVVDDSARHFGHAEAGTALESHFKVHIESECFIGLSLTAQHRLVYDLLKEELQQGVHALQLKTKVPSASE